MSNVIIKSGDQAAPKIITTPVARLQEAQALFTEALKRYKAQNEGRDPPWSSREIVIMSLITLKHNGFTQREIEDAMA
jgi:hypothetical protein